MVTSYSLVGLLILFVLLIIIVMIISLVVIAIQRKRKGRREAMKLFEDIQNNDSEDNK